MKLLVSAIIVLFNCGCTVLTVAGAAVGVAATAAGVAADVAIGTAKVVGKGAVAATGAVAGAVAGSDEEDSSGIIIVDKIRPAPPPSSMHRTAAPPADVIPVPPATAAQPTPID